MTADTLRAALARTTDDLARAIREGSGSLSIAAIAEERARIREELNRQKGTR